MSAVGATLIIGIAPTALKLLYIYHITALTDCLIRCRASALAVLNSSNSRYL